MNTFLQDLRYGFRTFSKRPGFTAVAVLSIALGIGANTTVFSWINTVLLHPMTGVPHSERLVALETIAPSGQFIDTSYPDFRNYRDDAQLLSGVLVFTDRPLILGNDRHIKRVWGLLVSGNYFDVLGVKPYRGRFFLGQEQSDTPGGSPVVVLSYKLWTTDFNSDPGILGRTIRLNRREFTVLGVTPEDFTGSAFGLDYDMYVPLMMQKELTGSGDWLTDRNSRPLHTLARLKTGAGFDQARAEIQTISQRLAQAYPDSNHGIRATLLPLWKAPYGAQSVLGPVLEVLMGVAGIVLLIVCANVANLLLAQFASRHKEIAVRLALGAGRGRIIRQMLTESLLLSLMGGAVGILMAVWMLGGLRIFVPPTPLPVLLTSRLDGEVLGFTVLLAGLIVVLFGLLPAIQATRTDVHESLKEGGRTSTGSKRSSNLRGLLVVSEVALAMVALVGAGLFVKSFERAKTMNPGFDPNHVLLAGFNLAASGYNVDQGKQFYRRLADELRRAPQVRAVSYAEDVPLGFEGGSWDDITISGYVPRPTENMKIYRDIVAPGYFNVLRIPLVNGRDFTEQDDLQSSNVIIVNDTFVRRFLKGQDPLGHLVGFWGQQWKIVGVVKTIKYHNLDESPQPYMYIPFLQGYRAGNGIAVHIRTVGPPEKFLPTLQEEVKKIDPAVPIFGVAPLAEFISASFIKQRIGAILLTAMGLVALLLATVGLYSVMAYAVTQRTHEIGVRLALGAQPGDVLKLVIGEGMLMASIGVGTGLAGALAMTRLISSVLLGVSATDPVTFILISSLLAAVALLASYIPARRATKVDPMIALRYE